MERRSYRRIAVQMPAEIEISVCGNSAANGTRSPADVFRGAVETIDMSLCGLSVKIVKSLTCDDKSFGPAVAYRLVGKEVTMSFKSLKITVWGKVVRIDPMTMLMAVIITKVSDITGWRELCTRAIMTRAAV